MKKPFCGDLPPVSQPIQKTTGKKIGDRIRMYRKYLGMKGFQFAKLIKISQGSLSDIENNKSLPRCKTIISLLTLSENPVDIKWLLTGEPFK